MITVIRENGQEFQQRRCQNTWKRLHFLERKANDVGHLHDKILIEEQVVLKTSCFYHLEIVILFAQRQFFSILILKVNILFKMFVMKEGEREREKF